MIRQIDEETSSTTSSTSRRQINRRNLPETNGTEAVANRRHLKHKSNTFPSISSSLSSKHIENKKLVIKLSRLTEQEVEKWTTNSHSSVRGAKPQKNSNYNGPITRSMTRQINNKSCSVSSTSRCEWPETNITKKRKIDSESVTTEAKKRKLIHKPKIKDDQSPNNSLPSTSSSSSSSSLVPVEKSAQSYEKLSQPPLLLSATSSTQNNETTVALNLFQIDEVIWGKIRGSCHWPAKIVQIKTVDSSLNGSMTIEPHQFIEINCTSFKF